MCNTILSSIYKLFLLSCAIFALSCQELEDIEEVNFNNELPAGIFPEPTEKPVLKTIKIGQDEFTYHQYSDGLKTIENCYVIADSLIAELEEFAKNPEARIEDFERKKPSNAKTAGTGYPLDLYWKPDVTYYIDPNIPNPSRIRTAVGDWDSRTSLSFTETFSKNQSGSLLEFRHDPDGRCNEQGTSTGSLIRVGNGCSTSNMRHEIGHALNLFHEHQRVDRGATIQIRWNNIDPDQRNQFRLINNLVDLQGRPAGQISFASGNFDRNSVMLYSPYGFSINGQPTMVDWRTKNPINPSGFISQGDVDAVEYMLSGRADDEALILNPFNVKAYYPPGKREADMVVTWDAVPNANAYDVYTLDHNGEFIRYRTVYDTRYKKELKDRHLAKYRIKIAAVNTFYGGYSNAIEADYNWK